MLRARTLQHARALRGDGEFKLNRLRKINFLIQVKSQQLILKPVFRAREILKKSLEKIYGFQFKGARVRYSCKQYN